MRNVIFRKDKIVELCRGKVVLHLGCVQHSGLWRKKLREDDWLHKKIAEVAKELVGFDYLKSEVEAIRKELGYECYFANVMNLEDVKLDKKFDVIVCGELIEHLENPGLMLDGIKRFMHKDSVLVITTPNPWSLNRLKLIKRGILEDKWLNKEHVAWYSYQTLKQLLERKGYEEVFYDYYYGENRNDLYRGTNGILGKLKLLKRMFYLCRTKKKNYDGLFFVSKIKN